MTLAEIRQLTDKRLLSFFSETSSNELTRNFAYTCFFVPDECAAIFTSFGNESRARSDMLSHLTKHILHFILRENGRC